MGKRDLTLGEIGLAKEVFKNSLDYSTVKVHDEAYIFFQPDNVLMTPNGEIYAPKNVYKADFSLEDIGWKELFIHEMTHVWQRQTGVLNPKTSGIWEFLKNGLNYDNAYPYVLETDKDLLDYGMEQQAAMVADYFLVLLRGKGFGRHNKNTEDLARKKELLRKVMASFIANPGYAKH